MISAPSAFADWYMTSHPGCGINNRHWHGGGVNASVLKRPGGGVVEDEVEKESPATESLTSLSLQREFLKKGFSILGTKEGAYFLAEVKTFAQRRYYGYGSEVIVFVLLKDPYSESVAAIGEGRADNVRRAAEKAVGDVVKKVGRKGVGIFIDFP